MANLTDFLLARVNEDAATALVLIEDDPADYSILGPRRLLAESEAKRVILREHKPETRDVGWSGTETICNTCRYDDGLDADIFPCRTISAVAGIYSAHPDYRDEWRP